MKRYGRLFVMVSVALALTGCDGFKKLVGDDGDSTNQSSLGFNEGEPWRNGPGSGEPGTGADPGGTPGVDTPGPNGQLPKLLAANVLAGLPQGTDASLAALCQNAGADRFTSTFCDPNRPNITSLRDLHAALNVDNAQNSSCTANSVSLVKNETSVLNPRCINFSDNGDSNGDATAVGYLRAELTFAEVVSQDPVTGDYRYFLVDFDLPCESSPTGCTKADFYLESAESGWQNISYYEDTQLKNTVFDCTMCHQPGGINAQKLLRMAETDNSWTHWFRDNRNCGQQLLGDFMDAHAGETRYAGLTLNQVSNSDPARLENFVEDNGFQGRNNGNNFFNSNQIINDLNNNNGVSDTWQQEYDSISAMENLANHGGVLMPFRECRQSDPQRLTAYTATYIDIRDNGGDPNTMPSLYTVNLDGEQDLRDRGMLPKAGMSAQEIMVNACMSCHNSNLDQTISRANFNAQDLTGNLPAVYDRAIDRLGRDKDDMRKMPPATFMNLTEAEIQMLTDYFNQLKSQ